MATILRFRAVGASMPPRLIKADRSRSAEIILFPGVRFERAVEERAVKPRSRRARERDTLKLDD